MKTLQQEHAELRQKSDSQLVQAEQLSAGYAACMSRFAHLSAFEARSCFNSSLSLSMWP